MKISIKENNKNIWDESIFIIENIKRIKDDPTMMVKRIIKDRTPMRLIIYLYTIFLSILTIFSILDNSSHIVEILFALYFVLCSICLFIKTIIYKKLIKKAADVFMNYVIEINDEGYFVYGLDDKCTSYSWEEVYKVIINKYSIVFISNNEKNEVLYCCSSIYKPQISNAMKEYNKTHLLIDNSDKYKK